MQTTLPSLFLFLPRVGIGELLVILLVILLVFGAKRIPELMQSFGKGIRSFREGLNEVESPPTKETKTPDAGGKAPSADTQEKD